MEKFVVFEGIDGSGKSTQISYLADHIRKLDKYNEVMLAREPTRKAKEVLDNLMQDTDAHSNVVNMARGYVEDRKKHWDENLKPFLDSGGFVICDRFTLSTLAYQSTQGMDLDALRKMHTLREIGSPNITFYLQIPAEKANERISLRNASKEKFEQIEFMEKLVGRYEEIIKFSRCDESLGRLLGKIEIVDATQSVEELARNICEVYDSFVRE